MEIQETYRASWAERAATDAALRLATARFEPMVNGRRDAVWRVRPDSVVELARGNLGRVELYEVHGDGTSQLVAVSRRSLRQTAGNACAYAAGGCLLVGVPGAMFVDDGFFALIPLMFVLFPLAFLLRWRSRVRPWVRARFGSDRDWTNVPYAIEGEPATGNQVIALAGLAERADVWYRPVADGTLEVVSRGKQVEVLAMDRLGGTSMIETRPKRRFTLEVLHGPDVTWHEIYARDPTD